MRRMADKQGLFVELETEEDGDLPQDIKLLLFESVRELLFNVVKHAQTRSAMVNVRHIGDHLQVIVSDQGAGFDPTAMPAAGASDYLTKSGPIVELFAAIRKAVSSWRKTYSATTS
jgi:signal transduction histidine kinase